MVFHVPQDSFALRYRDAYRQFTWEGARGPGDVKIVPEIRDQSEAPCIYEAVCTWLEVMLRMKGITCKLSSVDFMEKEVSLMTELDDRIGRCIEVLRTLGICEEKDYKSQDPNVRCYGLSEVSFLSPLMTEQMSEAVNILDEKPLLIIFHVDDNYYHYVRPFCQVPVLSYKKFEENEMAGHAACCIGYGTESIVPFWKIINSASKTRPTKGMARVLPQNVYCVIAPGELVSF